MKDMDSMIMEAWDLSNAVLGLDLLATNCLGSDDVVLDELTALRGLITAVKIMAETHAKQVLGYTEEKPSEQPPKGLQRVEFPYLTYGVGCEEDDRLAGTVVTCGDDVIELAEYFIKKYPIEQYSSMCRMFQVGFNCGQRCAMSNEVNYEKIQK